MENALVIFKLIAKKNFERLRESVDRKAWTYINPTDVNAFYRPSFNDISNLSIANNYQIYLFVFSFYSGNSANTFV
jgi:hypothetical protein